jgi:hypothetical protein
MDIQCANCGRIEEMKYRDSVEDAAKGHTCCGDIMHVKWALGSFKVDNGPYITSDRIRRPHQSKRAMTEYVKRKGLSYAD